MSNTNYVVMVFNYSMIKEFWIQLKILFNLLPPSVAYMRQ